MGKHLLVDVFFFLNSNLEGKLLTTVWTPWAHAAKPLGVSIYPLYNTGFILDTYLNTWATIVLRDDTF